MRLFSLNLHCLLWLALSSFSLSYKIDKSCINRVVESLIRDAMTSAFEMAEAARNRLAAAPLDRHTSEIVRFLFAKNNNNPTQLQNQGKLDKTFNVLNNVLGKMQNEITGDNRPDNDDVVRLSLP